MTNEQVEARMAFIIEQQATLVDANVRFSSQIASLIESDARLGAKIAELAESDARLSAKIAELAESDARLSAKIAGLAESDARLSAKIAGLAEADARLSAKIDALLEIQSKHDSRLGRLEDALRTVVDTLTIIDGRMDDWERMRRDADARMDALTATVQQLAQAQKNTDERLNVFIGVLERYIREDRNGES